VIDHARLPAAEQVRALQRRVVEAVEIRGRQHQAARRVAPRTGERGQAGDGARGNAAARVPLHAVIQADGGRLDRAVVARELHHFRRREPAGARCPFRRVLAHALGELLEAKRMARDVVAVDQTLGDQHVHHAERERAVGAG
jgi:hypothetical protein